MNSISGMLLDAYPGEAGYHYLFLLMFAFAIIGLVASVVLDRRIKKSGATAQEVPEGDAAEAVVDAVADQG